MKTQKIEEDNYYLRMAVALVEAHTKEMEYCETVEQYEKAKNKLDAFLTNQENKEMKYTWYNRILAWYCQKKVTRLWVNANQLYIVLDMKFTEWQLANSKIFKIIQKKA